MLVEESLAPHYVMVEDSPAPQYIAVQESPVPMSGVKDRPCLVVESPEPTEDRPGTTSPVPLSGPKDRSSLLDDSLEVPKANNLSWGGENPVEGGSATLRMYLVSIPINYISYAGPPTAGTAQFGGGFRGCNGLGPCFCFPSANPITYRGSWLAAIICAGGIPNASPAAEPCWSYFPSSITPPGGLHGAGERNPKPYSAIPWWRFEGGTFLQRWGACTSCPAPNSPVLPGGGVLWSLRGRGGLLAEAVVGHLLLVGVEVPCFDIWGAPLKHGGRLIYTCDCPRFVVHYETCIESLMAQVQDLRTQNPEEQRSQQELSQPVAAAAGISWSYGDRMTPIVSTLAEFDAVVQGYQRDSRAVAASVADRLKMSNSNTSKCFSAVKTLVTRYGTVASRTVAGDQWYTTPSEHVTVVTGPPSAPPPVPHPEPAAPRALMGAPSGSSARGCVLPFSDHPSHDCIYHPKASPDSSRSAGGGGTRQTAPSPGTHFVQGNRRKTAGTRYPRVEGSA